ncbi:hypothetical protein J1N35_022014 [Gossypium stocksii]|uniref:Uncharacterized protein n=1 Tax=Gossypium stocksii TaxID=47602 RepID=A0A9D4A1V5_9ROSI|nr:hypothetical protein J1N35_022014 [Gossypium stocksii]
METLKCDILLLDLNNRFELWQIKMQTVLAQMNLEDALLEIDKMPSTLTEEKKKRLDEGGERHCIMGKATIAMHVKSPN